MGPEKVDGSLLLNYVPLLPAFTRSQLAQLTALSPCLVWARLSKEETVPAAASRQWEHGPGRQRHASHRPHPVHCPHPGRHLPSQPAHHTPPLNSFHTTPHPWQVSLISLPFILSTALLPCTHFFTLSRKWMYSNVIQQDTALSPNSSPFCNNIKVCFYKLIKTIKKNPKWLFLKCWNDQKYKYKK